MGEDNEIGAECSKDENDGWHSGSYLQNYPPKDSPNGMDWQWQECAKKCAEVGGCEFWTLQLSGKKTCSLKANKGMPMTRRIIWKEQKTSIVWNGNEETRQ